jgi:hypothetical protein
LKRFLIFALAIVALGTAPAGAYDSHFGLGVGVVVPQDSPLEETMGITGIVGLPTFDAHVRNQLFADYWRKAQQPEANTPEQSVADLSFGFLLKYYFFNYNPSTSPLLQPYLGGGLGIHMYRAKNIPGLSSEKTIAKAGLHAMGGLAVRVNKAVDLTVEAQYIFSELDQFTGRVGVLIRTGTY